MVQDLDILGLKSGFFLNIPLKIPRKDINSSIGFTLTIVYLKIILG